MTLANLRLGPGLEHQVQEVLEPGTRIVVLEQSEDGEWWRLTAGSWIHGSLVELEDVPDGEKFRAPPGWIFSTMCSGWSS